MLKCKSAFTCNLMIFLRHEVNFAVRWALNINHLPRDATLQYKLH